MTIWMHNIAFSDELVFLMGDSGRS